MTHPVFDFVAVGENSLDLLCLVEALPEPDTKQPLIRRLERPGGQAATAAVGCARLGLRSCYLGAVGDDEAGSRVRMALEAEGVTSRLAVRRGVASRQAVVLVDRNGRRAILGSRDARLDVGEDDFPDEAFTASRLLLVDGSDLALSHRAASAARKAGVVTMVDLDLPTPDAIRLLREIDIVIVPADFACTATEVQDISEAVAELGRSSGAAVVVATDGARGCTAWADGSIYRAGAVPVAVVDTTGAGDAFRAGFAVAWLEADPPGRDLGPILRFASRVAALNCREFGAQAGLPSRGEVDAWRGSEGLV